MFCKRMAALHKKRRERLDELREAHRAESERLVGAFGDVPAAACEAVPPAGEDTEADAPVGRVPPGMGWIQTPTVGWPNALRGWCSRRSTTPVAWRI